MNVDLANQILASFKEHLGDTPLTWLRALLLAADQQQLLANGQTSIALADLDKQLHLLGTQPPSDDARRQRLKTINSVAKEELSANHGGKPPLQLKSRQKNIALSIDAGLRQALSELLQSLEREQVRNATTLTTALDPNKLAEPMVASKAQYQVFISHAWEDEDIEAVVDKFVNKLENKLLHLPSPWASQFGVKIYFDRKDIHGSSHTFEAQTDPACKNSAFGLLLVSDKWYASPACQREVNHFKSRHSAPDNLPYIKIQLCGQRDITEEQPLYPAIWDQSYSNLLDLFASNSVALNQQDKFLDCIRDEICSYLATLTTPPSGGSNPAKTPTLPSGGTGAYTSEHDAAIKEQKTTKPRAFTLQGNRDLLPKQELDDTRASEEILPLLHSWANSANSKNRVVALLGSFGSGKTVTSQLFARALADAVAKDPSQPEPIYLDLRRVQELYSIEAPVKPSLSQIIAAALSKAEGAQLADAERILRFIRSQPCVVIFDGLDEVGNRIGVEAAAQLYRKLLEIVPAKAWEQDIKIKRADWSACPARIMVTCRSHFFRDHLQEISSLNSHDRASHHSWPPDLLQRYYMAPLSREQVREVLIKDLGETEGQRADALLKQAHDLPTLARKPILARYISDLLPELIEAQQAGRALNTALVYQELFQRCIARDGDKNPLLNIDDRTRLLQALALELWQRRAATLPVAELDQWFDGYAESQSGLRLMIGSKLKARNLLHTELHNANLLVRSGSSDFAFVHSSFYEYFLALAFFECPDLEAYADWPQLSTETCVFAWEIAANADNKRHEQFLQRQQYLLTGERPKSLRALIVQISRAHPGGWTPPSGANLSDLDLSDASFGSADSDNICTDINFTNTNLRGCRFLRSRLQSCNFQGANIAQARFEHCHWQECSGTPSGVAAARVYRCTADLASCTALSGLVSVEQTTELLPVSQQPIARSLYLSEGHWSNINSATFSPDDSRILTASNDGSAKVWDTTTGICLLTLEEHVAEVMSATFSNDGSKIVTASSDETARIWNANTGISLISLEGHQGWVSHAVFSNDCSKIVTSSFDKSAKIWNPKTGECLLTLQGHQGLVRSAIFARDDSKIITASDDCTARIWDSITGECLMILASDNGRMLSATFNAEGNKAVTTCTYHKSKLWDIATGACIHTLEGHQAWVWSAAFSTDGSKIVTASGDRTARIWDTTTGVCIQTLEGHKSEVRCAAFNNNNSLIVTASHDGKAKLWHVATGDCNLILARYQSTLWGATFSSNASKAITLSDNDGVRIWDVTTNTCTPILKGHRDMIWSMVFSDDNRKVITTSADNTARVWDAATGECLLILAGHQDTVFSAVFSDKDVNRIITTSADRTARVWDATNGACLLTLEGHEDKVNGATFDNSSGKLVTASHDHTARIWDIFTGACLLILKKHQGPVLNAKFNSDDSKIITLSANDTARVWDSTTGACLLVLDKHMDGMQFAEFSKDGSKIISLASNDTTRVWDSTTGSCLLALAKSENFMISGTFGNNSSKIITLSQYGFIKVRDIVTGECLLTLRHYLGWLFDETFIGMYSAEFSDDSSRITSASKDGSARLWDANSGQLLRRYQQLPEDNWAVLDGEGNVLRCSPGAWPYVYGLSADGKVTSPSNHPNWARISAPVATQ